MELYSLLRSVTVNNWFCGEVSLLYAWSNGCTIESKLEQNKVRRILSKHGYKAHFGSGILNIEITIKNKIKFLEFIK